MPSHFLSSYDAFAKPIEGTRTRTVAGGIITVISYAAAGTLFLCQLYLYVVGETRHSLSMAESFSTEYLGAPGVVPLKARQQGNRDYPNSIRDEIEHQRTNRIPLKVHVTFPHIKCSDLDYTHDGAGRDNGKFSEIHGIQALRLTLPTTKDLSTALGMETSSRGGCTIKGTMRVPRVGGTMTMTVSHKAWAKATTFLVFPVQGMPDNDVKKGMHNCSHYIHSLTFGDPFPLSPNPLINVAHIVDNDSGIALNNIVVKLVPTIYRRPFFLGGTHHTYQTSVTQHTVQPQTLASQQSALLPGLSLTYDFSPLAVHHVETRDNLFVFLGSLVSIVGGVFVTVGLVTGCLYNSASAVAKKID